MLTEDEKARIRAEEYFRDEVRREISGKQTRRSARERTWTVLNSSFCLWVLSTVFIGGATAVYTSIQGTRAEINKNSEQRTKLETELACRIALVRTRLDDFLSGNEKPFPGTVASTAALFDAGKEAGASAYVFPEFKDRTFRSLLFEFERLSAPADRSTLDQASKTVEQIKTKLRHPPDVDMQDIMKDSNPREKEYLQLISECKELFRANPWLKRLSDQ
jgi:hypothetical protein